MRRHTSDTLDIVVCGLSITSSWGNGHATTYRALVRALARRGHRVRFLERDVPWYAENRDLPEPRYAETFLYRSLEELRDRHGDAVRHADLVIVGSYVPEGRQVGDWALATSKGLVAFYDIDTPVTRAALARGGADYLAAEQVRRYQLYLSFTGGPTLGWLERELGSPMARPLYCAFDPELYVPGERDSQWDLGYMGTYCADRQPALERLLLEPASRMERSRFVVAGPLYPDDVAWPANVDRIPHLAPGQHPAFYCGQRFTLNLTRRAMMSAGWSPSVRLFEAAACGVPIISDAWPGLETFFRLGHEILIARSPEDILRYLGMLDEEEARRIGRRARKRALAEHTAEHRVEQLESYVAELRAHPGVRSDRASR